MSRGIRHDCSESRISTAKARQLHEIGLDKRPSVGRHQTLVRMARRVQFPSLAFDLSEVERLAFAPIELGDRFIE